MLDTIIRACFSIILISATGMTVIGLIYLMVHMVEEIRK